jgi:hypothetical protein
LPIDVGLIPLNKFNNVFTIWFALTASGMTEDREWMYDGWSRNGRHSDEWVAKTKNFVDLRSPCHQPTLSDALVGGTKNYIFLNKERVSLDLCEFGFIPG